MPFFLLSEFDKSWVLDERHLINFGSGFNTVFGKTKIKD
ncbi:hypothetical protein LOT_2291 [Lentilactobacillus otakiensis DSM 19908 = JCM 15040]|uniref:Uncharacterized protein n=1 Tax=Lentilactobacillus otakiensis DSM 19908 = JCM 15040 TaxID=1423780 RepID=S4NV00_9LACO|nr:hypothetical protein LOT_2291 [Lentilactobacillus otakiensis DSM 19908 = JCM 15040]